MYESLKATYKGKTWQAPHLYHDLLLNLSDTPGINVLRDGHYVSRTSDFIIYSVEAEHINKVVAQYGPCELVGYISVVRI